jgi:integrase/recombinase XerD
MAIARSGFQFMLNLGKQRLDSQQVTGCSNKYSFLYPHEDTSMTPYRNRKTEATGPMAHDMQVRGFATRTIDSYTYHIDRMCRHFGKRPEDVTPEDIKEFQLWMLNVNESSWSQFNQAVCALRFLYSVTIPRDWVVTMIPFGKRTKKLPAVLSQAEVHDLIQCVTHPKHRALMLTMYAAGLRIGEATQLKLRDIDSERMQIKITNGKGGKQRYVPLSPKLLDELRTYWRACKPSSYLFPGKTDNQPLNSAVIQKAVRLAAAQARITKPVTSHTLRHSYATGLLEAGVDLMVISRLLGHSSFLTTMVYLHCRQEHLGAAPSPVDWLPVRQCPRWVVPDNPDPSLPTSEPSPRATPQGDQP